MRPKPIPCCDGQGSNEVHPRRLASGMLLSNRTISSPFQRYFCTFKIWLIFESAGITEPSTQLYVAALRQHHLPRQMF
jgi:hypothetical protein